MMMYDEVVRAMDDLIGEHVGALIETLKHEIRDPAGQLYTAKQLMGQIDGMAIYHHNLKVKLDMLREKS